MTAKQIQKRLFDLEESIISQTTLFCSLNGIKWTPKHNDCLRNAMRAFFKDGIYPIIKEMWGEPVKPKQPTRFKVTRQSKKSGRKK